MIDSIPELFDVGEQSEEEKQKVKKLEAQLRELHNQVQQRQAEEEKRRALKVFKEAQEEALAIFEKRLDAKLGLNKQFHNLRCPNCRRFFKVEKNPRLHGDSAVQCEHCDHYSIFRVLRRGV